MLHVKSYILILQFSLEDKVSGGASTLFIFTAHGCSFFNTVVINTYQINFKMLTNARNFFRCIKRRYPI